MLLEYHQEWEAATKGHRLGESALAVSSLFAEGSLLAISEELRVSPEKLPQSCTPVLRKILYALQLTRTGFQQLEAFARLLGVIQPPQDRTEEARVHLAALVDNPEAEARLIQLKISFPAFESLGAAIQAVNLLLARLVLRWHNPRLASTQVAERALSVLYGMSQPQRKHVSGLIQLHQADDLKKVAATLKQGQLQLAAFIDTCEGLY